MGYTEQIKINIKKNQILNTSVFHFRNGDVQLLFNNTNNKMTAPRTLRSRILKAVSVAQANRIVGF